LCDKNGIKREWNDAAESWVDFVRKGKDYYRDELNNPATFGLIGDVRGRLVLDLACGEGYNTRILAKKGANVIGVDFSERMIQLAKQEEAREKLGIRYYTLDATGLKEFSRNSFDLVTCFMSLQDIDNHEKAISEVARVNGKRTSATKRYFGGARYTLQWKMERLAKPFRTTSFHRTLTDYFDVLFRNRLCVSRLVEPRPTQKGLLKHPKLREALTIPQSIIIESTKCTCIQKNTLEA
jgi:SAM-dependent methyltransferase